MKPVNAMKVEKDAVAALSSFLADIPHLEIDNIEDEPDRNGSIDFIARSTFADRPLILACEVKANGQPRYIRDAIFQVQRYVQRLGSNAVPMVIAPFLSPQAQQLCRDEGVAFLDFEGNVRIASDTIFIERQVATRPKAEKRGLRSLFKPKSARILRTMLRDPARIWRVIELAHEAQVSVGHASTVGAALREREWSDQSEDGLRLIDPNGLLDAWAEEYEAPDGEQVRLYTHLHGPAFDDALRTVMAPERQARVALASFTAANWLGPYGRHSTRYLYADEEGLAVLKEALKLGPAQKAANVVIRVPNEDGVLADTVRPEPNIVCTSPVQTYLDLANAGERGQESAEHLREKLLQWPQ